MIRNFKELLAEARATPPITVSVAAADEGETLKAVVEAAKIGLAKAVLAGDRNIIEEMLARESVPAQTFEILHEKNPVKAAALAVQAVSGGRADILMKGGVSTSKFLQSALSAQGGLRRGLFSDVAVYEDQRSEARLVLVSDGGVNILPTIRQKLEIIGNAVRVAHRLGIKSPKVALLSGSEKVHPDFGSTIDAVALVKICQDSPVEGCVVDGPFALDNAIDEASARKKGIESPVAGRADILIVPSLEAGNIFTKGLQYYAGKMLIHVGMGALAPILIDSRSATYAEKMLSLALAKLMCGKDSYGNGPSDD
ncbi:MAG: phosphate butyryltransferase [Deltaproteobacteria bacterium]|nr:phosphate butyryltransferase [Deltaproteobacteria bacterium]